MKTTETTAVDLDGVTKRYDDVVALDELSLSVEHGQVFGFLGPNGSGKTTAIDVLLGFVRPTDGTVRLFDRDVRRAGKRVRKRIGVLPEDAAVYDRLTGREHVEFAIESKAVDDDPEPILERVGLEDAMDRAAGGYSRGMRQRLLLGMALVGSPDLLILDEPSAGLDPAGARAVREIALDEADRGATVFFSSHGLEQVEAVCDRVGILQNGRLVAEDTPDGLREATTAKTTLEVDVAQLSEDALETVRRLQRVSTITADGTTLTVTCDGSAKTTVLNALEDAGVRVRDFTTEEPPLEDVFLAYTERTGDRT